MVSICSILYKTPLCKLFGGVGCWFGVDGCNRFIVFQTHVSCSKTKKYVSMLNYKSFSIFKKCFSTSQSFKSSDILYLSIHLFPFSTHTYISTQDRCTVLPHIIQSKQSTFGDEPKRLLFFFFFPFQRELCSFLLGQNKNEGGIPEIPLPLALCLKYY